MSELKIKNGDGTDKYLASIGTGVTGDAYHNIPADFYLEISKGNVVGHSKVNKFGRNTDIDTGTTPEDIWDAGGIWVPPTTARLHNIVSNSANDTSAGSGTRTIQIFGLDASFDEQTETVTLNGTTDVTTANTYTRIFRMISLTAGSSRVNEGIINATAQTDGTVTAQINVGKGQTLMAIYTVPNGKTAYIKKGFTGINKQGSTSGAMADMAFKYMPDADTANSSWRTAWEGGLSVEGTSFITFDYSLTPSFTEKTDIKLNCIEVTDSGSDISGGFDLILIDN